jgi:hypothetical protein
MTLSMTIWPIPAPTARSISESGRFRARRERDGQLPAGADVDVEALLHHPSRHLDAEERLARVVDARARADGGGLAVEGRARLGGAAAHVVLVDHVEGRAEAPGELGGGDPGDAEGAVVVTGGAAGPDRGIQRVRVVGELQPGRGQRVRGHSSHLFGRGADVRDGERTRCGP